jgi:hypothetical protein
MCHFERYMQPGALHMVLTLEPSFVHGSHFYSTATLTKTLHSRWVDHTATTSTNAINLANEVWLHAILGTEFTRIFCPPQRQEDALVHRPHHDELASLVLMCLYPGQFEPEEKDETVASVPGLKHSRDVAIHDAGMLVKLAEIYCREAGNDDAPAGVDREYLSAFLEAFERQEHWLDQMVQAR